MKALLLALFSKSTSQIVNRCSLFCNQKENIEQGLTNIDFRNHAILAALLNPLHQQAKPQREASKQLRKQAQPAKPFNQIPFSSNTCGHDFKADKRVERIRTLIHQKKPP